MEAIRAFIAIELEPPLQAALADLQSRLKRNPLSRLARWVDPGSIHLTLKFLGDVPEERLPLIGATLDKVCRAHVPFALRLAGLGCFPNARRPRVVWAGVEEETGRLERLQMAVERELAREGFPREERRFTPHLTLARVHERVARQEVEALGNAVSAYAVVERPTMMARAVHLIESDLRPSGAVYTVRHEATLAEVCT